MYSFIYHSRFYLVYLVIIKAKISIIANNKTNIKKLEYLY